MPRPGKIGSDGRITNATDDYDRGTMRTLRLRGRVTLAGQISNPTSSLQYRS